jgi:acetoin utilization deacetylase AcuC-like enzyme
MGDQHPECPERIGAVNDMLLIKACSISCSRWMRRWRPKSSWRKPMPACTSTNLAAQSPKEGTVQVDPDTSMNPHSHQAALRAAGAAVMATDMVLTKAPHGFCNVRPPGHHAEYSAAGGSLLTTPPSAYATRSTCTGWNGWHSWISTSTTATAAKTSRTTTSAC